MCIIYDSLYITYFYYIYIILSKYNYVYICCTPEDIIHAFISYQSILKFKLTIVHNTFLLSNNYTTPFVF